MITLYIVLGRTVYGENKYKKLVTEFDLFFFCGFYFYILIIFMRWMCVDFKKLNLRIKYRSNADEILNDFYIPVLKNSIE